MPPATGLSVVIVMSLARLGYSNPERYTHRLLIKKIPRTVLLSNSLFRYDLNEKRENSASF